MLKNNRDVSLLKLNAKEVEKVIKDYINVQVEKTSISNLKFMAKQYLQGIYEDTGPSLNSILQDINNTEPQLLDNLFAELKDRKFVLYTNYEGDDLDPDTNLFNLFEVNNFGEWRDYGYKLVELNLGESIKKQWGPTVNQYEVVIRVK